MVLWIELNYFGDNIQGAGSPLVATHLLDGSDTLYSPYSSLFSSLSGR